MVILEENLVRGLVSNLTAIIGMRRHAQCAVSKVTLDTEEKVQNAYPSNGNDHVYQRQRSRLDLERSRQYRPCDFRRALERSEGARIRRQILLDFDLAQSSRRMHS